MGQPSSHIMRNKIMEDMRLNLPPHILIRKLQVFIHYKGSFYHTDTSDEWITEKVIENGERNFYEEKDENGDIIIQNSYNYYLTDMQIRGIVNKYKQTSLLGDTGSITIEEYQKQFNKFNRIVEKDGKRLLLFNLLNGVLSIDLETGKKSLEEHHEGFQFTSSLDFEYNHTAKHDLWLETLHDILPDPKARMYLQHFMAYSLLNKYFYWETCLLLYGIGHNGKGTLIHPWKAMFRNKKVKKARLEQLTSKHGLTILTDADINIAGESNKQIDDTSVIKTLTSGEEQTIDPKHKTSLDYFFDLKLVITANKLPKLEGRADRRRFVIIWCSEVFDPTVSGLEDDVRRKEKLLEEIPGIFNWIITLFPKFYEILPDLKTGQADRTLATLETLEDPIQMFINEYIYEDNGNQLSNNIITKAINVYTNAKKFDKISIIALNKMIVKTFVNASRYKTKNVRGFNNITLNDEKLYTICKEWSEIKHDIFGTNETLHQGIEKLSTFEDVPKPTKLKDLVIELLKIEDMKYIDVCKKGEEIGMTEDETKEALLQWVKIGLFNKTNGIVSLPI